MSRARARRIELPVPVFTQREAECGNTSLKAVLWYLGRRLSATEVARRAGTTSEGTEHAGLVAAARGLGAAVFERRGGTVEELRWFLARRHPVLIGWWSLGEGELPFDPAWSLALRRANDCGHFSVVSGIDATRIAMMDPDPQLWRGRWRARARRWMPISDFRRAWYDTDTPSFRHVAAWYMVVHDSDERFAPQLGAGVDHPPAPAPAPAPKSPSRRRRGPASRR